ncbi:natterin-3-like [Channa argus]|uniref:natterin-3-like n=1 Tax=Channa argus TaxID=215402 RepID=UPI003522B243
MWSLKSLCLSWFHLQMRFSVLLLLLPLLAVTSAAPQEIVPDTSQLQNVSVLNPDLENGIHQVPVNDTTLANLNHSNFKKVQYRSSFFTLTNTNLQWVTWPGSLPNGAVSIYNEYEGRTDYVCNYGCSAGFYNPSLGSYCRYAYGGKEELGSSFEILVNKDQLELLEWKAGSYGCVPLNSINTCSWLNTFVGKNKYGLGKVVPKHAAFFLPYTGKEYWYKYYQVLTVNKDVQSEQISNVKYKTAKIVQYPPETMRKSTTTNNGCQEVVKTVTLTKKTEVQQRWDSSFSITEGVKTTITAQIPNIVSSGIDISAGIEFSTEKTQQFSKGTTEVESIDHSVSVQLKVPPNSTCTVKMVGYKYKADIPFTAQVRRTYKNGEIRQASITGTYNKVQVGEVVTRVERCVPIPNARPCV